MIILPTNSVKDTGYNVDNSLRFNPASNDRLTRTPSTSGNRNKWTWSGWAKRGTDNEDLVLFGCYQNSSYNTFLKFALGGEIRFEDVYNGSTNGKINTLAKFRDLSAWLHIVLVFDTGNATSTDRLIFFVNGIRITNFDGSVMPSNASTYNVDGIEIQIGALNGSSDMNGYISEVCFIDNQALGADSFGEFDEDSGIWKPIDVSGLTFGTNGFYLEFKESGTGTNASGMGADTSGNTNHFAVNNLTAVDQTTDTCTNNFCTMNPLDNFFYGATFSEGNLKLVQPSSTECYTTSTIAVSSGKWYWEIKITASGSGKEFVGIADTTSKASDFSPYSGNSQVISYYGSTGHSKAGSSSTNSSYGNTFGAGDIIGVALDLENNKLYFSKNGTFQNSGNPTSGSTGTGALAVPTSPIDGHWFAQFSNIHNTESTFEANFGNPTFSISSGNTDGNGYGNFEYAVPSGYYSLNTKNLAEYG